MTEFRIDHEVVSLVINNEDIAIWQEGDWLPSGYFVIYDKQELDQIVEYLQSIRESLPDVYNG